MLTGTVAINDHQIIEYRATNEGRGPVVNSCLYNVWVKGRDNRGYPFEYEFKTTHFPRKGAAGLVSVIMAKIADFELEGRFRGANVNI